MCTKVIQMIEPAHSPKFEPRLVFVSRPHAPQTPAAGSSHKHSISERIMCWGARVRVRVCHHQTWTPRHTIKDAKIYDFMQIPEFHPKGCRKKRQRSSFNPVFSPGSQRLAGVKPSGNVSSVKNGISTG